MDKLWPQFDQPAALLITLFLWALLWLLHRCNKNTSQWEQILPSAFHSVLLNQLPAKSPYWPIRLLALAALFIGLALSQPRWEPEHNATESVAQQRLPIVVIIPLTLDSLASDVKPSRLQLMQQKTLQVAVNNPFSPMAVIVYSGSAHTVIPLTSDTQVLDNLLPALHPDLMPVSGHNAGAAMQQAVQLLQQAQQAQGNILLFSSGLSSAEQSTITTALRNTRYQLHILGVGTPEGAPLIDPATGEFVRSDSGSILTSRLQSSQLKRFAKQINASYTKLTPDPSDLNALQLTHSTSQIPAFAKQAHQGYWFLIPLLLVLAPLARRGWLLSLVFALCVPIEPSWAEEQSRSKNDSHATSVSQDPVWQGIAAYNTQDYERAIELFAQSDSAIAAYNLGNAYMQLKNYTQAISAYQTALERYPQIDYAADNLRLAEQLLKTIEANTQEQLPADEQEQDNLFSINANSPNNSPDTHALDLESWLRHIPDNPSELLRQKFWLEYLATEAP